ncbi:hypothetical protein DPV78_011341 [Talaromyces pinophilus]|nr:hypothetical protein DPV78_011341 [Talaromyces pinophilus]
MKSSRAIPAQAPLQNTGLIMCAARRGHFLTASQPYAKGTCYTYLVQEGDNCIDLAATYTITVDDILSYNNNTWGCWMI